MDGGNEGGWGVLAVKEGAELFFDETKRRGNFWGGSLMGRRCPYHKKRFRREGKLWLEKKRQWGKKTEQAHGCRGVRCLREHPGLVGRQERGEDWFEQKKTLLESRVGPTKSLRAGHSRNRVNRFERLGREKGGHKEG